MHSERDQEIKDILSVMSYPQHIKDMMISRAQAVYATGVALAAMKGRNEDDTWESFKIQVLDKFIADDAAGPQAMAIRIAAAIESGHITPESIEETRDQIAMHKAGEQENVDTRANNVTFFKL